MKPFLLFIILITITFLGCSTYYQSFYQPGLETTNFRLEIEKLSNKEISGEGYSSYILGFIKVSGESEFADGVTYGAGTSGEYADLKSAAAYDAIMKNGCDVIIAPRYIVETSNAFFFRSVTVKVYGYPGKYLMVEKIE